MKDLLGYFLIAQAIITGVIVHTVYAFSGNIMNIVFYAVTPGAEGAMRTGVPDFIWSLLIIVIGLGIFVIAKKK